MGGLNGGAVGLGRREGRGEGSCSLLGGSRGCESGGVTSACFSQSSWSHELGMIVAITAGECRVSSVILGLEALKLMEL